MEKRQAREVRRELTAEEQQRWQAAQEEAERGKQAILAEGRRVKKARNRAQVALRDGFKLLKAERQALGLSLSDVEQRSGIGRAALSRLENEAEPNPTLLTLTRYAQAVGKQLVVGFRSEKGS
jgi:DNA-binding phage protein